MYDNKYILQKLVDKLNEKGFNKFSIMNISKEELKPIMIEIYQKYHTFAGLEKSPKEVWKKVCKEIIQEFNAADIGNVNNNNNDAAHGYNENDNNSEDDSQKYEPDKSNSDDEDDKNSNSFKSKSDDEDYNICNSVESKSDDNKAKEVHIPVCSKNDDDPAQTKNDEAKNNNYEVSKSNNNSDLSQ